MTVTVLSYRVCLLVPVQVPTPWTGGYGTGASGTARGSSVRAADRVKVTRRELPLMCFHPSDKAKLESISVPASPYYLFSLISSDPCLQEVKFSVRETGIGDVTRGNKLMWKTGKALTLFLTINPTIPGF